MKNRWHAGLCTLLFSCMAVHAQESEDYATRLRFLFRNADAAIEDLTVKYSVTVTPFTPLDHIPTKDTFSFTLMPFTPLDHIPTKDTFSFTLMRNPSPPTLRLDVDRYDSQKKIHFRSEEHTSELQSR